MSPAIAIDAYEGSGVVDWAAAARSGLVMGIAKISEYRTDRALARNWPQIVASGAVRGGYVFLHPSLPAGPQVARALSAVKASGGVGPTDVLVWDLEITEGRSPGQLLSFLKQCVLAVRGAKPELEQWTYSYEAYLRMLGVKPGQAELFGTKLWVADYGAIPREAWIAHQYTSSGWFPGMPGRGDLSQLRPPTRAALRAVTDHRPHPKPTPAPAPAPLSLAARRWLRYVWLPAHYKASLIAHAWRRLSANPPAERAIVARDAPPSIKGHA